MEASSPEPPSPPSLPQQPALGYDPKKPVMALADLLQWPFGSIVEPGDERDSVTIARELREASSQREA